MKIATLNIDWGRKYKSAQHYLKIVQLLNALDVDFLVLTEAVALDLRNFPYQFCCAALPANAEYEGLNYTEYLHGETAYRTMIYSKHTAVQTLETRDARTSIAVEFETKEGNFVLYATIIGTRYKQLPYATTELGNCILDCEKIYQQNKNLMIVGDLNTSFLEHEKEYTINAKTTEELKRLFARLDLINVTENIKTNIDHIIIPQSFLHHTPDVTVFVEKAVLSDHQGVMACIKRG
jgi:endonuclease/exonuclease/phosphatase family metal-dependent hydrolase